MSARALPALLALLALFALLCAGAAMASEPSRRDRNQLYGAIAYHPAGGQYGWATDRRTSKEARLEALRQCGHDRCEVVATVTRACAALAREGRRYVIQKGSTQTEAEAKALRRCGPKCEIAVWTCTR